MFRPNSFHVAALCITLTAPGIASAEELTLSFRFVTQDLETISFEAPGSIGHFVGATRSVGTAIFEDDRIARKTFVYTSDDASEGGDFTGYSVYEFENGDTLELSFNGDWSADHLSGTYDKVIAGTGAFAGATGQGSFDGAGANWEGATLWNGELTLTLPGS